MVAVQKPSLHTLIGKLAAPRYAPILSEVSCVDGYGPVAAGHCSVGKPLILICGFQVLSPLRRQKVSTSPDEPVAQWTWIIIWCHTPRVSWPAGMIRQLGLQGMLPEESSFPVEYCETPFVTAPVCIVTFT